MNHFKSPGLRVEVLYFAVKITGKLSDGTVFFKKGHSDNEDDLFEFNTDEGI